jgi:hypothetical protein
MPSIYESPVGEQAVMALYDSFAGAGVPESMRGMLSKTDIAVARFGLIDEWR